MPSHGFKLKRCQGCHTVWEAADFKPGTDLCWRCWDAAHPIKRQDTVPIDKWKEWAREGELSQYSSKVMAI